SKTISPPSNSPQPPLLVSPIPSLHQRLIEEKNVKFWFKSTKKVTGAQLQKTRRDKKLCTTVMWV
ncbi:hypothetical protein C5167_044078, partial [Papaver somniferum]